MDLALFWLLIHSILPNACFWSLRTLNRRHLESQKHKHTHMHTFTGICWLISMTHSLKPCLCGDTKHGSQQCTAQPTPLIYHVNFSNSPCSPCWPDNPCRRHQTNHTDRKCNGSWGSAQCVSGYDTPVNQMEIPQYASQRAVVLLLLPRGATDVISLSALQPTSQITCPTSFFSLLLVNISILGSKIKQHFAGKLTHYNILWTIDTHESFFCIWKIYSSSNYLNAHVLSLVW